jgi:hypothetical protein
MKRYDLDSWGDDFYMSEAEDGVYVEYADVAALTAENERLRTHVFSLDCAHRAAEARLATAVGAIEACIKQANGRASEWGERAEVCFEILDAFLASAQPAAPARAKREPYANCTCPSVHSVGSPFCPAQNRIAAVELSRRGLK